MSNWKQRLRDRQLAATAKERWQRPDRGGAVYLIRIGDVIKVGRSVNPDLRIRTMQLPQSPDEVVVLRCGTNAEAMALEGAMHERYAAFRVHGEWFSMSAEQMREAHAFGVDWQRSAG